MSRDHFAPAVSNVNKRAPGQEKLPGRQFDLAQHRVIQADVGSTVLELRNRLAASGQIIAA